VVSERNVDIFKKINNTIGPFSLSFFSMKFAPLSPYFACLFSFSGVAQAGSPIPNAPSNPRIAVPFLNSNSVEFYWQDNSINEEGFQYELRLTADGAPVLIETLHKDLDLYSEINGGTFGDTLFMRVRAVSEDGESDWSEQVTTTLPTTPLGMRSRDVVTGNVGDLIEYQVASFGNVPIGYTAEYVPAGLSFDTTTGLFSGSPTVAGVSRTFVTVTDGTSTASAYITFRFSQEEAPPMIVSQIPGVTLLDGIETATLNLNSYFDAPGIESGVRIKTNLGNLDIALLDSATPFSVENFLNYVTRGDYTDVLLHRSTPATSGLEIIQSGWFKHDGTGNYQTLTTDPTVVNERGFSNVRGTLAMAKVGGNANSGSSQWYFNVSDSASALDPISNNGGFSVFGKLSPQSLAVIDDIHSRPVANYTISLDGSNRTITDWPTKQTPSGALPGAVDYVQILSANLRSDPFTYEVKDSTPGIVLTSIADDGAIFFNRLLSGTTTLEITATDFNGNSVTTTMAVSVEGTGDPNLDFDKDGLSTLMEFALGGNPQVNDADSVLPTLGQTTVASDEYLTLSFLNNNTAPPGILYTVEYSEDLATWTPVWTTSDGFNHPNVVSGAPDNAITVRATSPISSAPAAHMRLRVELANE
jgi:cyclophilin family peptidyl-prolyl cis-trans isomerase